MTPLTKAREWEQPVLLRTTTRVNHLRGPVEYGPLPGAAQTKPLTKNPQRFVPVPAIARVRHGEMIKNLETARNYAETCPWNTVTGSGSLGVICSGISRAYVADALADHGWTDRVRVFELGMSYPLPEKMLEEFIRSVDTVLVVEEGEPLVENDLRALAHRLNIDVTVLGKGEALTRFGEYATTSVADALSRVLDGKPLGPVLQCNPFTDLPGRPPNLCAGCSHRATYYAVRKIYGDNAVYSSDIGCYTLGILPPLMAADFLLCMGSSISAGTGMAKVDSRPVVAFIGDSTFFHSGITGLINAVHNQHNILLVILDNRTTAMTGHQLNPGVDQAIIGDTRTQGGHRGHRARLRRAAPAHRRPLQRQEDPGRHRGTQGAKRRARTYRPRALRALCPPHPEKGQPTESRSGCAVRRSAGLPGRVGLPCLLSQKRADRRGRRTVRRVHGLPPDHQRHQGTQKERMMQRTRIYLTGVGGQGTLTATTLLARTALAQGCEVTSGEIHGMAQRGGVVESTVLLGGWKSPKISYGEADVILGFEPMETLRGLPYLAKGGLVISSTDPISPIAVSRGLARLSRHKGGQGKDIRLRGQGRVPAHPQTGRTGGCHAKRQPRHPGCAVRAGRRTLWPASPGRCRENLYETVPGGH